MIPEAREVRVSRKERLELEARCRLLRTLQRDLKRARIVLLAEGCSTRAIAKTVGMQPRIVSHWRHRFTDEGLAGLEDKPRPGKKPIYMQATGKRILALLDKPPPAGFARWNGPLLARRWRTSTSNMFGASCASTRSIFRLANPGARATIPNLRPKPPMWLAFMSILLQRPLSCASMKSRQSRLWSAPKAI
jgi:transposase